MLSDELVIKLKILQAKKNKSVGKSVSFSKVVCDTLRKDLK